MSPSSTFYDRLSLAHSVVQPHQPRVSSRFVKSVGVLLIASLLNTSMLPLVQAAQTPRPLPSSPVPVWNSDVADASEAYAQVLQRLRKSAQPLAPSHSKSAADAIPGADDAQLLEAHAQQMREEWKALRQVWSDAGVAPAVQDRQQAIEEEFEHQHAELVRLLKQPQGPATDAALDAFVTDVIAAPVHKPVDVTHMPWQVQPSARVAPLLAQDDGPDASAHAPSQGITKAASVASEADLSDTAEAAQTPAIKALAQALDGNPFKLFQWVHDQVFFTPTYGSVQGAQDTLDKRSGNAFDQASLLIAMLRSSGIPARYVYGTIEVPVDDAMNWVGGTKTADAAQQILNQGGVPNVALVASGRVVALRMEHVWVEALVRASPDRAAMQTGALSQGGSWVPMDPGFKQYRFEQGVDFQRAEPFDAQALLTRVQSNGVTPFDPAAGWSQGVDAPALRQSLDAYGGAMNRHIQSLVPGRLHAQKVLGGSGIEADTLPYLAASLPYTVKARSAVFSDIPARYKARFRYRIYADVRTLAAEGTPLLNWESPTALLAGKTLSIRWAPATEADLNAIVALLASAVGNGSGNGAPPSRIPNSVQLKPELRVDGVLVATGAAVGAGTELIGAGAFTAYGGTAWDQTSELLIAGQQSALGLSIQGVSHAQMQALESRMKANRAAVLRGPSGAPLLSQAGADAFAADMLNATLWSYFLSVQRHGFIAASQAQMYDAPALSYGLLHMQAQPNKLYGKLTTGVTLGGVGIDIGHLRHVRWVLDDDAASAINALPANGKQSAAHSRWIAYNQMRGLYSSAMEHMILEEYWVDYAQCRYASIEGQIQNPDRPDCVQAISAVKAIAIAQQQGQRIYAITPANASNAFAQLRLPDVVQTDVRAAVLSGKTVQVHEKPVSASGWKGVGYVISDPSTGAAAYLISGGYNGGIVSQAQTYTLQLAGMIGLWNLADLYLSPVRWATAMGSIIGTLTGFFLTGVPGVNGVTGEIQEKQSALCLTDTQGASLNNAVQAISSVASIGHPSGTLAMGLAMAVVMDYLIYFVKMNRALGECDRSSR